MQTKRIKLSQKYPIKLNAPTFKVPSPIENNMRITLSSTLAKPQKRMHMVGLIGCCTEISYFILGKLKRL